ncbi:MAG: hypothetical protein ACKPCI_32560 [Dolichospermum sp.]
MQNLTHISVSPDTVNQLTPLLFVLHLVTPSKSGDFWAVPNKLFLMNLIKFINQISSLCNRQKAFAASKVR